MFSLNGVTLRPLDLNDIKTNNRSEIYLWN